MDGGGGKNNGKEDPASAVGSGGLRSSSRVQPFRPPTRPARFVWRLYLAAGTGSTKSEASSWHRVSEEEEETGREAEVAEFACEADRGAVKALPRRRLYLVCLHLGSAPPLFHRFRRPRGPN